MEDKGLSSAWVSDSVLWLGGAIVAVAATGGLVWLITQRKEQGSQRSRQKTKKEVWKGVREPTEHLLYLYSALGSNPIDREIIALFCQTYGQRTSPAITYQSNKAIFANEELIQLSIEKLRGLLSLYQDDSESCQTEKKEDNPTSSTSNIKSEQIESVLSLVSTLLLVKANAETFINEGGVPCILKCMALSISLPLACSILNIIVHDGHLEDVRQQRSVVSCIIQCIRCVKVDNTEWLLEVTNVLRVLLKNSNDSLPQLQEAAHEGIDSLVLLLKDDNVDYKILLNSLVSLNFFTRGDDVNVSLVVEAGIISHLSKLVEAHAEDPLVIETLLSLILNITSGHSSASQEVARHGMKTTLRQAVNALSSRHKEIAVLGSKVGELFAW